MPEQISRLSANEVSEQQDIIDQLSEKERQESLDKLHQKVGARLLTALNFQVRHERIAISSQEKMKARGNKYEAKSNNDRRNMAYIDRLNMLIEKHGSKMEQKLWRKSLENNSLYTQLEDVTEGYWKSQEQILRDNGQGGALSNREKGVLVEDIRRQQKESLSDWANYLAHVDCPYPMWFKVYAFEGISRMGVYNKDKKKFEKRDKTTVAPYPHMNAAILGKTYDAIADIYNLTQEDFNETSGDERRDALLEKIVKDGNFNNIYSKFISEASVAVKTPERTEDIRGEWIEYLPGDEEALAVAADGTPWCVASPTVGRNYLEAGEYGQEYIENNENSKAKFILFHVADDKTGVIAQNACASIRLNTDGYVAEISGLNDGQALEDSVVPIVEEKVKTLPGGEEFLKAFEDKKHLISMDRIMQANEISYTNDDIDFIFELNREIKTLDTYNCVDPRIIELREYILKNINDILANNTDIDVNNMIKGLDIYDIEHNIDALLTSGIDTTELAKTIIRKKDEGYVAFKLGMFLEAGANATELANAMVENNKAYYVVDKLDEFLTAGANIDVAKIIGALEEENLWLVTKKLDSLLATNIDINKIAKIVVNNAPYEGYFDNINKLILAGVDATELANKIIKGRGAYGVLDRLDVFLSAGVDATELANLIIENNQPQYVIENLDNLLAVGININTDELIDHYINNGSSYIIMENLDNLLSAGVNIDIAKLADALIRDKHEEDILCDLNRFIASGADIDIVGLVNNIMNGGEIYRIEKLARNIDELALAGLDATEIANSLIKEGRAPTLVEHLDGFLENGANINFAELADALIEDGCGDIVISELKKFKAAGVDVDVARLANNIIRNGSDTHVNTVAGYMSELALAGLDATEIANSLIKEGRASTLVEYLDEFLENGANINFAKLANALIEDECEDIIIDNLSRFIASGADIDVARLANNIIRNGSDTHVNTVACHMGELALAGLDATEIANSLIKEGHAPTLVEHLDVFLENGANINFAELADALIGGGHEGDILRNLDRFIRSGVELDIDGIVLSLFGTDDENILYQYMDSLLSAEISPQIKEDLEIGYYIYSLSDYCY